MHHWAYPEKCFVLKVKSFEEGQLNCAFQEFGFFCIDLIWVKNRLKSSAKITPL